MKEVEKLSEGVCYSAVNLGSFSELADYALVHPVSKRTIDGKVFLKDATHSTGTEISFNAIPPHTEVPYFHIYYKNEETYMILQGEGFFQVDDDCFAIRQGSVVRVAPAGKRGLVNSSDQTMLYVVVQSKENSLEEYTTTDGERVVVEPKWR